jgi:hypothetical protein
MVVIRGRFWLVLKALARNDDAGDGMRGVVIVVTGGGVHG